jgi:uncharacterized caspase-like protein
MDCAIAVGCQRYEDEQISSLKYAERDVERFATAISEVCDLEPGGILFLSTNPQSASNVQLSTRSSTLRALNPPDRRLPRRTSILRALTPPIDFNPPERLFFYFSGHGVESAHTQEPYLLPCDTAFVDIENSAVPMETLMQKLKLWQARTTVLFLDICRAVFSCDKAGLTIRAMDREAFLGLPPFSHVLRDGVRLNVITTM